MARSIAATTAPAASTIAATVSELYRTESRRVLATLIRLIGDFDLAEEGLHDAFAAALAQWPTEGIPENPRAWLVSTGRFKAIDQLRRRARFDHGQDALIEQLESQGDDPADTDSIEDDRLRLIFTCCHPSLSPEARLALTLREVCDLTTEEIARACLTTPSTLAQRIVRAKNKIRTAKIPYEVPGPSALPERLGSVLQVVYLVFNEGYSATAGDQVTRHDLSAEAIRLGRLLVELLPEPEALGLLALMLLHESRRAARVTPEGDLILLENQNRTLWNKALIEEGDRLIRQSLASGAPGMYTLQAAIAALHAAAPVASETDWSEIVGLYDVLLHIHPSAVVALNRAVAVAMRDGPGAGLALVESILAQGDLQDYHLAHAARADFCRRLGQVDEARKAYQKALGLVQQEPERRFLESRLATLENE